MTMPAAKVIALYFPQLHPIPENDAWWGKGFTDWVNVQRARPLFPHHYQPRVPLGGNYYDQSRLEVIRWQVELARAHGIHGFAHYHYWFDGKQLLETPTNLFMANKDLDLHFCLTWANETWSRRWDGQDHYILQHQTHPPVKERWALHFDYLIKAWTDERAIRIDGKPLFLIYRPGRVEALGDMLDYFRTRAQSYGLPGLYFVTVQQSFPAEPDLLRHFDAVMLFQPFVAYYTRLQTAEPPWTRALRRVKPRLPLQAEPLVRQVLDRLTRPVQVDYDTVWREILASPRDPHVTQFLGGFVDWDNTARYRNRSTVYQGAAPAKFEFWMRRLLGAVTENREEERLIFLNAWNEWAEGAYLEPDERHGHGYLEALRRAIDAQPRAAAGAARPGHGGPSAAASD